MSDMDISSRIEFPAKPDAVCAMMRDLAYLEEVCEATHAKSFDASVEGLTTRTSRSLPAPDAAARFTGPELTVVEETIWEEQASDGVRNAALTLTVAGQPVAMKGRIRLSEGGAGTVAELTGQLKVSIPLLGRKMEQASAPAVLAGFRKQEEVGRAWLSRKP